MLYIELNVFPGSKFYVDKSGSVSRSDFKHRSNLTNSQGQFLRWLGVGLFLGADLDTDMIEYLSRISHRYEQDLICLLV